MMADLVVGLREIHRYLCGQYDEEFLSPLLEAADALRESGDFIAAIAARDRERVDREETLREALAKIASSDEQHWSDQTVRSQLGRARRIAQAALNG